MPFNFSLPQEDRVHQVSLRVDITSTRVIPLPGRVDLTHNEEQYHGAQPAVLVVFDDDVAETHFLRIAKEEMDTAKVQVPLFVAPRNLLERVGPLGPAWRTPDRWEPIHPFNDH